MRTANPSGPRARSNCPICVLRRQGLCEGVDALDADASAALDAAHAPIRVYDAGDVIYEQGDGAGFVFNLISGWVALHRDFADGRRQIIQILQPSAMFGVGAAGQPLGHSATAITNASVCPIETSRLAALRLETPSLNERYIWLLQRNVSQLQEMQATIGQGSARERIASLLCELAKTACRPAPLRSDAVIRLPLTQRLIAEASALTPIHVNRVLRQLREEGVVEFQNGVLTITSAERLQALATQGDERASWRRHGPSEAPAGSEGSIGAAAGARKLAEVSRSVL